MYIGNVIMVRTGNNPDSDEGRLILDCESSETIDSAFSTFVDKLCDALKKESDFRKVRRKCLENVNVIGGMSLSKDTLNEIRGTKDFDELFEVLCSCTPYWNWMNVRMLEKIAGDCSTAKKLIGQYKNEVFSKKVMDIVSEIPILDIPTDKYTEVKEKWNKDFNDLTVKDIVSRWSEIEKKFNVEESMILKSITDGCVELCWVLPNDLVEHAQLPKISMVGMNQLVLVIKRCFLNCCILRLEMLSSKMIPQVSCLLL